MKIRIEHIIICTVALALEEAGDPVIRVVDPYDDHATNTPTVKEVVLESIEIEIARLETRSGKWLFIIDGNGQDVIVDYHIGLSDIIEPVYSLFQD